MRLEKVDSSTANKLFRQSKLQAILDEFNSSEEKAMRCVLSEGEYVSISSAQSSYTRAIQRLKYPIRARVMGGDLYLIKTNI